MKTGTRGSVRILGFGAKFGVESEWAEERDLAAEAVERFFLLEVDLFRVPEVVDEVLLLALLLNTIV